MRAPVTAVLFSCLAMVMKTAEVMTYFNGSNHSSNYAAFRPSYPEHLFKRLAALTDRQEQAWDIACGSGQASAPLSKVFVSVLATDVAPTQIQSAPNIENIRYVLSSASDTPSALEDRLGLEPESVDLITVAQALHWFVDATFYENVRHFLRRGGVFACWTYALTPSFEGDDEGVLAAIHQHVLDEALGPYWPEQRRYIDMQYADIPFPFERQLDYTAEPFDHSEVTWTLASMFGYISSLSAYQLAVKSGHEDPIGGIRDELIAAWGSTEHRLVRFPIFLLAGRK